MYVKTRFSLHEINYIKQYKYIILPDDPPPPLEPPHFPFFKALQLLQPAGKAWPLAQVFDPPPPPPLDPPHFPFLSAFLG